jgi:hypothetical protein
LEVVIPTDTVGSKVRVLPKALMDQTEAIASRFDLKKLARCCNFAGCQSRPAVEVLLFEKDAITEKRKDLASLYLCGEHYRTRLAELMRCLEKDRRPGKTNGFEVFSVGYASW